MQVVKKAVWYLSLGLGSEGNFIYIIVLHTTLDCTCSKSPKAKTNKLPFRPYKYHWK
jgi:hypothetical protein